MQKWKIIIFFLFVPGLLSGCAYFSKHQPEVKKGIIDLGDWDFERDGPVSLDGEWEFFWMSLITPEEYISGKIPEKKNYYRVPREWNPVLPLGDSASVKGLSHKGYATYVLKIKGLEPGTKVELGLKLKYARSAYSLYFLPEEKGITTTETAPSPLMKNGIVGRSEDESIPQELPLVKSIPHYGKTNIILIHISNFRMFYGGIVNELVLGSKQQLQLGEMRQDRFSFLILGILIMMFLYHAILYFLIPGDRGNLLFSLVCGFIALWYSLFEKLIQGFIIEPSSFIFMLLELLTAFSYSITLPLFATFLWILFKKLTDKKLIIFIWIITLSAFIIRLLDYSNSYPIFFAFNFLIIVFAGIGLFHLIRGVIRKTDYALASLSGFLIFFLGVSNDVLKTHMFLFTPVLSPFGLVFFIITHSYILSRKYKKLLKSSRVPRGEEMAEGYMKSYLSGVDVEEKKKQLGDLMEKDKIYRDENLTINMLSHELSLSRHQMSELINIKMNTNFTKYINGFRVEEAKELLLSDRERSILSIAYDVGFNSSSSFYRIFKKFTGITPMEYREKY